MLHHCTEKAGCRSVQKEARQGERSPCRGECGSGGSGDTKNDQKRQEKSTLCKNISTHNLPFIEKMYVWSHIEIERCVTKMLTVISRLVVSGQCIFFLIFLPEFEFLALSIILLSESYMTLFNVKIKNSNNKTKTTHAFQSSGCPSLLSSWNPDCILEMWPPEEMRRSIGYGLFTPWLGPVTFFWKTSS